MAEYQRPVLLLNETEYEMEVFDTFGNLETVLIRKAWEGSARGYDKSALTDFRKFCLNKQWAPWYAEGHSNAFGFGILDDTLSMFIQECDRELKNFEFTPCYSVDFIFNADNFNPKDIIEIADLKSLWGQGIEEPYIALTNVRVSKGNIQLMSPDKNPTLKISLPNGTSLIKFKFSKKEYERLNTEGYLLLDVVGRCEINAWGGKVNAQIIMEDYDVVDTVQYYF
jgi:single-stranded DNA-specific DHH superfamily exonuclease